MPNENEPKDEPQGILVREQPVVVDKGDYHLAVRGGAEAEIGAQYADMAQDVQWANYQISQILHVFRESDLHRGVNDALHQRAILHDIGALNRVFRELLSRLKSIIRSFVVPMHMDNATGLPALNTTNTQMLRTKLSAARDEMRFLPKSESSAEKQPAVLAPNHEMMGLFDRIGNEPRFLEEPRNVIQVFEIVDAYLKAVIQTTGIGLASTVYHTSQQIHHLQGATDAMHDQAEAAEVFEMPHDDETTGTWHGLLSEIELVFAEAVVRAHALYGENIRWMLGELDMDEIRKALREIHLERKKLEGQKSAKRQAQTADEERSTSVIKRLFTRAPEKDPTPFGIIHQWIDKLSQHIGDMEKLIDSKKDVDKKAGK